MKSNKSLSLGLIGYGRMGKAVERIARDRGHLVTAIIDREDKLAQLIENGKTPDVCIEFTTGESAAANISFCLDNGIPVVSGSTGWLDEYENIEMLAKKNNGAFFYASNFSVGVHLFMKTARQLSALMNSQEDYDVIIEESHHIYKKDAPSGTAITLAENVIGELERKTNWQLTSEPAEKNAIPVMAKRVSQEFGYHRLLFHSPIDAIGLDHRAFSRDGFALGAVLAAEFIKGKAGVFGMDDLLQ